jgi:hypothetical protein
MKHKVFVFSKTNYSGDKPSSEQIKVGKPYLLIKQEHKRIIMSIGDKTGDGQETSYFYELDKNNNVMTNKVYSALTNWWHTELKLKDAEIIGEMESSTVYSKFQPYI